MAETGTVWTLCAHCGSFQRIQVRFPDWKSPFEPTNYRCTECKAVNILFDNHKYDEEGNIIEEG